jgi:signal transduction histidine kinase
MAAKKRLHIDFEVDAALLSVFLDPGKLKQVLFNYLSNAVKFTPDGGHITVHAAPEGAEEFRIEVKDTGIGIKSDDFGRLFVQFQQLDTSATKQFPGTGLGLALTKKIVEAQGGKVGVTSVFGKGSCFFATLPRSQKGLTRQMKPP